MHYYRFNIPDWTLHTAHLSPEEEGVYFRLVNFYYDTEQPIPEETQSVIRRLRLGSHADTVSLILSEFFTLRDGYWHHKRCDLELETYHAKAEQNRLNGKRGGRPSKSKTERKPKKTQSVISGNPKETLTNNHKPPNTTTTTTRPTVEEIAEYVATREKKINPQAFHDYYTANGWKVGRNSMKDWKAAVRTWEKNEHGRTGQNPATHSQPTVADKLRGRLANMQ